MGDCISFSSSGKSFLVIGIVYGVIFLGTWEGQRAWVNIAGQRLRGGEERYKTSTFLG